MCWINIYLGPPNIITHNTGKNFISKEFKQYAIIFGTVIRSVPVEAHNLVGMVERYYGPLRRIYYIITAELPDISPDGLIPTLLVFGAYPRMVESDAPNPTVIQQAAALKKAMEEVKKLRAERQVADALNMRNRPKTTAIHDLPLNLPVLVWREGPTGQPSYWSGPHNLLSIENKTYTI